MLVMSLITKKIFTGARGTNCAYYDPTVTEDKKASANPVQRKRESRSDSESRLPGKDSPWPTPHVSLPRNCRQAPVSPTFVPTANEEYRYLGNRLHADATLVIAGGRAGGQFAIPTISNR